MTIRLLLPAIVSILVLLVVLTAGHRTYTEYNARAAAVAFVEVNRAADLLLSAAGSVARERGTTAAGLNVSQPSTPERTQAIGRERAGADQTLREALTILPRIADMKHGHEAVEAVEKGMRDLQSLRQQIDQALSRPAVERPADIVQNVTPRFTRFVETISALRLTLEALARAPTPEIMQLVQLRSFAAATAEYAGQERALVAALASARAVADAETLRRQARLRGAVEFAWSNLAPVRTRVDLPPNVAKSIDVAADTFFGVFQQTREAALRMAESGQYTMSSDEWFAKATTAINTLFAVGEEIGVTARNRAEQLASASSRAMLLSVLVLGAGLLVAAGSFWIALWRIVAPLQAMTTAMKRLADSDTSVEIPGLGRGDEIGVMAQAVGVFKENAIERQRLAAEKADAEARALAEKRKAAAALADEFQSKIGHLIQSLAAAASEMEASARSMTATAEHTTGQSVSVASAAEQTSANVQTVAVATEELSASIREISEQVAKSSAIAGRAADEARRTDATVQALAAAAQKIGDVIALINNIAGQTNLLALNATIEAARAGEAGRGFAVVASEVKELASQTAKATEEIAAQISGIQEETKNAVAAIQTIGSTIGEMNGIAAGVAAAMEEQGAATSEIARNVQQAAQGTQVVTGSILDVKRGAGETGSAASQVLAAAQELARHSEDLGREIDDFLSGVKAA